MKLPELHIPTYIIDLPISKQQLRFRPYLVDEQKILFMANESDDNNSLVNAMTQVMNNCIVGDSIDLTKLPQVDVEYYFYQLRARSQSELVTSKYRCNNKIGDKPCGFIMEHEFDLTKDLEVINTDIKDVIALTETVGIKFHTPYFEVDTLDKEFDEVTVDDMIDEIIKHIDYIYDENTMYRIDEIKKDDLVQFLGRLTSQQMEKIEIFFDNLPKIIKNLEITCPNCGFKHKIVMEDIFSFFL